MNLTPRIKRLVWFLLKAALSVVLLYLALRQVDLKSLGGDLQQLNVAWLLLGILQSFAIPLLGGARWQRALRAIGTKLSFWPATRLFWIGMVFSQVLPSVSGGDAARAVIAWREGLPLRSSIHSVLLERIVVLLTLIAVVALMQMWWRVPVADIRPVTSAIAAAAFGGLALLLCADRMGRRLPRWPPVAVILALSSDARKLVSSPLGGEIALLAVVTHLNFAVVTLWLGNALGLTLSLGDYLYLGSIVTLIATLPLSIGGWGVRENAAVILFGAAGVAGHAALALSVLSGLVVTAVSLVGLPFLWASKGPRFNADAADHSSAS